MPPVFMTEGDGMDEMAAASEVTTWLAGSFIVYVVQPTSTTMFLGYLTSL